MHIGYLAWKSIGQYPMHSFPTNLKFQNVSPLKFGSGRTMWEDWEEPMQRIKLIQWGSNRCGIGYWPHSNRIYPPPTEWVQRGFLLSHALFSSICFGVIHKIRGHFWGIFTPSPPSSWSLLLYKAYVIKWSFS